MNSDQPSNIRSVRHPVLPQGPAWEGLGSDSLLDAPAFVSVVISRRWTRDRTEAEIRRILDAVRCGAVAVGGFISDGEQRVARILSETPGARIIRLVPYPLRFYRPSRAGMQRIAEGTTLILSGFTDGEGFRTRERCLQSNDWARALETAAPVATLKAVRDPDSESEPRTEPDFLADMPPPPSAPMPPPDASVPEPPAPSAPTPYAPEGDPGAVFL